MNRTELKRLDTFVDKHRAIQTGGANILLTAIHTEKKRCYRVACLNCGEVLVLQSGQVVGIYTPHYKP